NVANLLLMHATARQKELAIRSAMGASRWMLVRQLLIESLLLAGLGGASGLLLAWWNVDLLNWLKPGDLPRLNEIGIDRSVFAFTALISFFTGLVFGIVPAMTASKPDLLKMFKEGAIAGARSRLLLRNALFVSEVAVAVLLLAGAGLLLNSFLRLQRVNTGVDVDRVLTSAVVLPSRKYSVPAQQLAFYQELLSRIEMLPGVESGSISTAMPLG